MTRLLRKYLVQGFTGASAVGLVAVLGTPLALNAQDADDDTETLEELEVFETTGSRIRRLDVEPVAPVINLGREELQDTGFTTVGDVLRSLTFNNGQALTPTDSGTSFTPGVSTVNLRGLGNNQTLVLINGRRAAPYASPGFNGLQTVFDLNSIPASAIDEIEILKDGASALYGSDAVGGVVNVKLRSDYQGLNTQATIGDYFDTGGTYKQGSIVVGTSDAKSSVMVVAEWMERDSVFARDLDYAANADKTDMAHEADPRWEVENWDLYINEATGMPFQSEQEYIDEILGGNPIETGEFDNRSIFGFPGWVWADSADLPLTSDEPLQDPASIEELDTYFLTPYYNYQELNGLFPEERRIAFYTTAHYDIADWITAYAEVSFTRAEAKSYAAPALATTTEVGFAEGEPLTIPAENPFNPYGVNRQDDEEPEDITFFGRRMVEAGNRINDVESDTPRIVAGLTGDLTGLEDWTWDAYALYSKNTVTNLNRNAIPDERMQEALIGLTDLGAGQLTYDPATPEDERVYFNWFGRNSDAMARYLQVENPNVDTYEMWQYEANVSGALFDLPGGPVGVAFGAEKRLEELENIRTDLNQKAGLLGGGVGQSTFGERDVKALYAEAIVPVFEDIVELQLAGRYEEYSDEGFEDDIRPKVGIKIQPLDWVVFKGSYSESFKAPDLAFLYNSGLTTFTSNQYNDPRFPDRGAQQLQVRTSGNPNLAPETADIFYAGVVLEPTGMLEGLAFEVEWFKIEQENLLGQLTDFYSYGEILLGAAEGDPTFVDMVVRDPETEFIQYILDSYQNISEAEQTSIDFTLEYRWENESVGDIFTYARSTWIESYKVDGIEYTGSYLTPEWNHTFGVNWQRGDWEAAAYASRIDSRTRSIYQGVELGGPNDAIEDDDYSLVYEVEEQWTVNASVTYGGFFDTDVTLGVNNIFNEDPPVDPLDHTGTTAGLNRLEPAFWYIRLEKEF